MNDHPAWRGDFLDELAEAIYNGNVKAGWWSDKNTGERIERNYGEMMALIHSEISESLEADRKDSPDDKLPQYHGRTVELIDAVIRIMDVLGHQRATTGISISEVLRAKIEYNAQRADHKLANRLKAGGKAY